MLAMNKENNANSNNNSLTRDKKGGQ
jgi:hypothetical protein